MYFHGHLMGVSLQISLNRHFYIDLWRKNPYNGRVCDFPAGLPVLSREIRTFVRHLIARG